MSNAGDDLRDALAAETDGRLAEAFILGRPALTDPALQADGFNLFGRLCWAIGDAANAIASQRYVLRLVPGHARATGDLAVALGGVRASADAAIAFEAAIAVHPDIISHHRDPESLEPFDGIDDVEAALRRAIDLDPSSADAHAALGNVLARARRVPDAFEAYRIAVMLAWERPDLQLAMAGFFDTLLDDENAERHRAEAFARARIFPSRAAGAALDVLVLAAPGDPTANAPLDYCIDHTRVALHRYYLARDEIESDLPAYDLVFNAIEDAERSAAAIARCARFVAAQSKPVLNDPLHLARVRRSNLPHTLHGIGGCIVPQTIRIDREQDLTDAHRVPSPWLVRPIDTHRGDGQERIATVAELAPYLDRTPGTAFNVSSFVDYRSIDGLYRKYRVVVIGGRPYAYHLAISDAWKVHYHSSLMFGSQELRDEEERFLREPRSVFANWDAVFGAIAEAVGLEYFGVDCALDRDGNVLVFECGPSMLVQCGDERSLFPYKYDYVPKIFAALEDLLYRTAGKARGAT